MLSGANVLAIGVDFHTTLCAGKVIQQLARSTFADIELPSKLLDGRAQEVDDNFNCLEPVRSCFADIDPRTESALGSDAENRLFAGASSRTKSAQNVTPKKRMTYRHAVTVPSNVRVVENCREGQNRSVVDVSHTLTT